MVCQLGYPAITNTFVVNQTLRYIGVPLYSDWLIVQAASILIG